MIRLDFFENVEKYSAKVNEAAMQSIIEYCGIALKGRDSQFVSMTDETEIVRVVEGFAANKLGLDEATAREGLRVVHLRMKAEKSKMRTTVYYLLAEETGKLPMLPKENSNLKSLAHKRRQKTEIVAPRQSGSWKGKFTAPASVFLPLSIAELRDWGSIDEIAT